VADLDPRDIGNGVERSRLSPDQPAETQFTRSLFRGRLFAARHDPIGRAKTSHQEDHDCNMSVSHEASLRFTTRVQDEGCSDWFVVSGFSRTTVSPRNHDGSPA
jgi:hypothetical protein